MGVIAEIMVTHRGTVSCGVSDIKCCDMRLTFQYPLGEHLQISFGVLWGHSDSIDAIILCVFTDH